MQRAIVGFDQDDLGDWRAVLACGHRQHVRHNPPLVERPWVLTAEGRSRFIGAVLDCRACDEGEPVSDAMISPEGLAAIYAQFEADLARYIRSHVAPDAADDILLDVYQAIHAQAGDLDESDGLVSRLDQIVHEAIGNRAGRAQPGAGDHAAAAELSFAVRAFLACLPGPFRQALLLVDFQGLTADELADRLDISPTEARSRIGQGREMLREALSDWCHFAAEGDGAVLAYRAGCPACVA